MALLKSQRDGAGVTEWCYRLPPVLLSEPASAAVAAMLAGSPSQRKHSAIHVQGRLGSEDAPFAATRPFRLGSRRPPASVGHGARSPTTGAAMPRRYRALAGADFRSGPAAHPEARGSVPAAQSAGPVSSGKPARRAAGCDPPAPSRTVCGLPPEASGLRESWIGWSVDRVAEL